MPPPPLRLAAHLKPSDLRALSRLAIDGTQGVVGIVEQMHATIGAGPLAAGERRRARGPARLVYGAIRGVTSLVGQALDHGMRPLEFVLERASPADVASSEERASLLAVLNGIVGDHLVATGNPLATPMALRDADGQPWTAPAGPAGTLYVLVHGLCMQPGQWRRPSGDLGRDLVQHRGGAAAYLHYNTGRAVATNGREFAALLESIAQEVQDIVLVGHSMGGLVARSACRVAEAKGHAWRGKLRAMVFLGTPHHGAPLERGGHGLVTLLGASPYTAAFARLGDLRSAGIQSLRHGTVLEEDEVAGGIPAVVPLPQDVRCFAVAGVLGDPRAAVSGRVLGDGLVTVASATGRHADGQRRLHFDEAHVFVAEGHGHLDLLHSAVVRDRLLAWL